ncbi:MAG: alpha/beta fold hydrolase [Actinomycetota bacterium]
MSAPTRHRERPGFLQVGEESLFVLQTEPLERDADTAVVFMAGTSQPPTTERNSFAVRFCRRMAGLGFLAMRFDYRGTGESTGIRKGTRPSEPATEDLVGVVGYLETSGYHRFVLGGTCYGAITALTGAVTMPAVKGLVLLSIPIRNYDADEKAATATANWSLGDWIRRATDPRVLRGLLDRENRLWYRRYVAVKLRAIRTRGGPSRGADRPRPAEVASPLLLGPLEAVVRNGVPVLIVYGTEDEYVEAFEEAMQGRLGEIVRMGGPLVQVEMLRGRLHGFAQVEPQDDVMDVIERWLEHHHGRGRSDARADVVAAGSDPSGREAGSL